LRPTKNTIMDNVSFSAYLHIDRISLQNNVSSKKRVFECLGKLLSHGLEDVSATQVSEGLIARERLGTTALGDGVAIPHCRIDNLNQIRSAIIKLDHAIDFEAPDDQHVSFVCALMVPSEANDDHLKALASLAEFLSNTEHREALNGCQTAEEILEVFASTTDQHAA